MRVHRLRGLLYGSYYDACCYLISSSQTSEEKQQELQQLAHQTNGFSLAEQSTESQIPYRWVDGASSNLRLRARRFAQQINKGEVSKGRWPLLSNHLHGLWPSLTEGIRLIQAEDPNKSRRTEKEKVDMAKILYQAHHPISSALLRSVILDFHSYPTFIPQVRSCTVKDGAQEWEVLLEIFVIRPLAYRIRMEEKKMVAWFGIF